MGEFRYVVINPTGQVEVKTLPRTDFKDTLSALQKAVGGYIEAIGLPENGLIGWVNEDGYAQGLKYNYPGMAVLARFGWTQPIVGPLVFTGEANQDAAGLTDFQLSLIQRLIP